jgi:predicted amidohydrolase YtcJ
MPQAKDAVDPRLRLERGLWADRRYPTAADRMWSNDRPVLLERIDGHAIVTNSAAMKAAESRHRPGPRLAVDETAFVDAARELIGGSSRRRPRPSQCRAG